MESSVLNLREMMPKAVLPETVTDCSIYHDSGPLYWCNAVDQEADKDQLYCAGTFRIYEDGVMIDEYVDAPGATPVAGSLFQKIFKDPGNPDASFTTYRVHMGVLWTP